MPSTECLWRRGVEARMDRELLKQDLVEVVGVGLPVWIEMPSLPAMGVQKGQVEFCDLPDNPKVGIRILTEGFTPQGKFVYLTVESGEFWPRSIRVDGGAIKQFA
ncbi:MAG: hypothetical protein BWY43_00285 [candidate division WS2 bacterium ADurb.Bin280]|uniref:Uncharacterized protein n=1 Tax=candidate division WS2 bacterium ADurb.Bin280 TaxID=1852829 RepID=A0A1V5SF28_9BACT|nr:MAG: hypothetical protein BWY43_00285 [candidate division WS2 bacterium ADurb.Bin280]